MDEGPSGGDQEDGHLSLVVYVVLIGTAWWVANDVWNNLLVLMT